LAAENFSSHVGLLNLCLDAYLCPEICFACLDVEIDFEAENDDVEIDFSTKICELGCDLDP
jgi:hypothetical protein